MQDLIKIRGYRKHVKASADGLSVHGRVECTHNTLHKRSTNVPQARCSAAVATDQADVHSCKIQITQVPQLCTANLKKPTANNLQKPLFDAHNAE